MATQHGGQQQRPVQQVAPAMRAARPGPGPSKQQPLKQRSIQPKPQPQAPGELSLVDTSTLTSDWWIIFQVVVAATIRLSADTQSDTGGLEEVSLSLLADSSLLRSLAPARVQEPPGGRGRGRGPGEASTSSTSQTSGRSARSSASPCPSRGQLTSLLQLLQLRVTRPQLQLLSRSQLPQTRGQASRRNPQRSVA